LGKFWRVLQWKVLVYFMDTWSILRYLVIFYGHLVYFVVIYYIFSHFGILYQEKSGNPGMQLLEINLPKIKLSEWIHFLLFLSPSCCFTMTTELTWDSQIRLFHLCQMSSHLQAAAGCSGTPYRNIKTHNSMHCRAFAGYHSYNSWIHSEKGLQLQGPILQSWGRILISPLGAKGGLRCEVGPQGWPMFLGGEVDLWTYLCRGGDILFTHPFF
jgi:hypothetical protein